MAVKDNAAQHVVRAQGLKRTHQIIGSVSFCFQSWIGMRQNVNGYYGRSTGGSDEANEELVSCRRSRDMHSQPYAPSSGILAGF
jgi:hypothetical protein